MTKQYLLKGGKIAGLLFGSKVAHYLVKVKNQGRSSYWTKDASAAKTFTRAEIDAFKAKYPHIKGRVVIKREGMQ